MRHQGLQSCLPGQNCESITFWRNICSQTSYKHILTCKKVFDIKKNIKLCQNHVFGRGIGDYWPSPPGSQTRTCTCFATTRRNPKIKCTLLVHLTHGLFLTWTQKSHYIYRLYTTIFTRIHGIEYLTQPNPLHSRTSLVLLTWRTSFFSRGDEYPSTLVSDPPTTAPPFAFSPLTLLHFTVQITLFT